MTEEKEKWHCEVCGAYMVRAILHPDPREPVCCESCATVRALAAYGAALLPPEGS